MKYHFSSECTAIKFNKCPKVLCTQTEIRGVEELKKHLIEECQFTKHACSSCEMKTERAMINFHDCVKALKKKVLRQKEKLKIAEHEKSVIRLDLEALRNHTIKSSQASCDIFEVTCTYGHPVKSYKNSDPRRHCDKCSIEIGEELYYRCNQSCSYDLCRRCAACP